MDYKLNYLEIFLASILGAILFVVYTILVLTIVGLVVDLASLELTKWILFVGFFVHGLGFVALLLKILVYAGDWLTEKEEQESKF